MSVVLLVIIAFAVLSIIVLVHELGHFLAAKRAGVWVEEFGLGLPPRVWGKKFGETLYSINLLPIGGFVKLHGETSQDGVSIPSRAFVNKSKKARIGIALAGIVMNFFLAIFVFSIFYSFAGIVRVKEGDVKVMDVAGSSPAQISGILVGDVIVSLDGNQVKKTDDFINLVETKKGKKVTIEIKRTVEGGTEETKKISLTPRVNPPEREGSIGVTIAGVEPEIYFPPIWQRPFYGAYYGVKSTIEFSRDVIFGFAQISRSIGQGKAPEGVVGPVGIFAIISQIAKTGILPILNLIGIISLNLAIFNLIPFPPLDGSRVLFVLLEGVVSKKYLPKVEFIAHSVGMGILLLILLLISGREIPNLIKAGSLSGFVDTLIK